MDRRPRLPERSCHRSRRSLAGVARGVAEPSARPAVPPLADVPPATASPGGPADAAGRSVRWGRTVTATGTVLAPGGLGGVGHG